MKTCERHSYHVIDNDPDPPRVTIVGIVNNGTIVTVIGRHTTTDKRVHIYFDHRCFAAFWGDWLARGSPQPITWDRDAGVVSFADGGSDG